MKTVSDVMKNKGGYGKYIIMCVIIIIAVAFSGSIITNVKSGTYQIKQAAVSGKMVAYDSWVESTNVWRH